MAANCIFDWEQLYFMNNQAEDNGSIADLAASPEGAAVRQLLARIARGDEQAFRTFFDRYRLRFFKAVLKMTGSETTAEEIVQEVFMQVWSKKESLTAIEHPDSYFFYSCLPKGLSVL